MDTNHTTAATLFAAAHRDVEKRIHASSILVSIVLLLIGLGLFSAMFLLDDTSSAYGMTFLVLGTSLVLYALYRLCWRSRQLVYLPSNSRVERASFYFDSGQMSALKGYVETRAVDPTANLHCVSSGNVRLDVLASLDRGFVAVQLFQFVPYTYAPVTSICEYRGEQGAGFYAQLMQLIQHS